MLSEDTCKIVMNPLRKPTPKNWESGQATTELILLLIIIIIVFSGALYQLNDAFKNYLEEYFGNYLACLLETGELPGLGSEEGNSSCVRGDFRLSSGQPLPGGALQGGGGSSPGKGERLGGGPGKKHHFPGTNLPFYRAQKRRNHRFL